jgi:hypothetical protein
VSAHGAYQQNEERPVLEEAIENLKESARLVRAAQNRLWSAGKIDHPAYRELTHRARGVRYGPD